MIQNGTCTTLYFEKKRLRCDILTHLSIFFFIIFWPILPISCSISSCTGSMVFCKAIILKILMIKMHFPKLQTKNNLLHLKKIYKLLLTYRRYINVNQKQINMASQYYSQDIFTVMFVHYTYLSINTIKPQQYLIGHQLMVDPRFA